MEEFLGPQADYNEEEEEKKYYRRKRLGIIKNVVAASIGAMIVYSVYMGEFPWRWGAETGKQAHTDRVALILINIYCICTCVQQASCRCSWSSTMIRPTVR